MAENIEDLFEKRAREGDAGYAIAFAVLQLSKAQGQTAKELQMLGSGTLHERGAVYEVAASLSDVASRLDLLNISASVSSS